MQDPSLIYCQFGPSIYYILHTIGIVRLGEICFIITGTLFCSKRKKINSSKVYVHHMVKPLNLHGISHTLKKGKKRGGGGSTCLQRIQN